MYTEMQNCFFSMIIFRKMMFRNITEVEISERGKQKKTYRDIDRQLEETNRSFINRKQTQQSYCSSFEIISFHVNKKMSSENISMVLTRVTQWVTGETMYATSHSSRHVASKANRQGFFFKGPEDHVQYLRKQCFKMSIRWLQLSKTTNKRNLSALT